MLKTIRLRKKMHMKSHHLTRKLKMLKDALLRGIQVNAKLIDKDQVRICMKTKEANPLLPLARKQSYSDRTVGARDLCAYPPLRKARTSNRLW